MGYKWALLSCVALAGPAFAADELAFGPPPGWVTVQPVPDRAAGSAEGPVDFLLSDAQVKLEPESATSYAHYAIRFNNAQGLAAGNVIAGWNPAFDTATIHKVVLRLDACDFRLERAAGRDLRGLFEQRHEQRREVVP